MLLIRKYIPALFTVTIWGSTFVASKYVISAGISPVLLMTIRFALAYFILLLFCREKMFFYNKTTELKIFFVAISGGSLYFLLEYLALQHTSAVNVGLITATVPIISCCIDNILKHQKPSKLFIIGSLIAFFGVLLLVTDGKMLIDIFPLGDLLAIGSTLMWAIYTIILSRIDKSIPEVVIERKMMLYSLITILPFSIFFFSPSDISLLSLSHILIPILYLSCIASAFCLWLWNISINTIGVVHTNNFLYLLPVISLLTSAIFIDAEISGITIISTLLILIGIILADR